MDIIIRCIHFWNILFLAIYCLMNSPSLSLSLSLSLSFPRSHFPLAQLQRNIVTALAILFTLCYNLCWHGVRVNLNMNMKCNKVSFILCSTGVVCLRSARCLFKLRWCSMHCCCIRFKLLKNNSNFLTWYKHSTHDRQMRNKGAP